LVPPQALFLTKNPELQVVIVYKSDSIPYTGVIVLVAVVT